MATTIPDRIELQNRFFLFTRLPGRKEITWMLVIFLLVTIVMGVLLDRVVPFETINWEKALRYVGKSLAKDPWNFLAFIVVVIATVVQVVYVLRARRIERLVLTRSEIRFQTALPGPMQFLMPGWSARWEEIAQARLTRKSGNRGPIAIELVLKTVLGEERTLRPFAWIDPEQIEGQGGAQATRRIRSMSATEVREAILESPVLRFMSAHVPRLEMEPSWGTITAPLALEANARTLIALTIFAALTSYTLTDLVKNSETYATQPPYGWFAFSGLLVAILVARWLRNGKIPLPESVVLGVLLGVTFGAALYPGLLRVNQLTDTVGMGRYIYHLQANGSLAPLQAGPPTLSFPRFADYWASFKVGSVHEFHLRKGGLGFYQIDMAPVNKAMRRHYRNEP